MVALLEIKEGRRTDVVHNCPKRNTGNGGALDTAATTSNNATTTTPAIVASPELLKTAEELYLVLQDYLRLKRQEATVTAAKSQ
jgi:hypothetical protein